MIQCSCGFLRILATEYVAYFRSHQTETTIIKRLIQGRNNLTRMRVEPRSRDQGRRKSDAFTPSAALLTRNVKASIFQNFNF